MASPPRCDELTHCKFSPRILRGLTRPPHNKVFHFAGCEAQTVLSMMSVVLTKLISLNDEHQNNLRQQQSPKSHSAPGANNPLPLGYNGEKFKSSLLGFHGSNVPGIGIEAYLSRILKYCPMTPDVFLALLVYFDRIAERGLTLSSDNTRSLFMLDSFNIHRLIIAGMTVASKFFSDIFYKSSRYAKVGGLPVEELNSLELQFILLLDFKLMVQVEELQKYADFILNYNEAVGHN